MARGQKTLQIQKDQYIRLPLEVILRACLRKVQDVKDKMRFIDFCRRLLELYRCRMARQADALRKSFELLVPKGDPGKLELADIIIRQEEDVFLEQLHQTLINANFKMLTKPEYDDAMASEHTLALDLTLNAKKLDAGFIRRFLDAHDEDPDFDSIAPISRHVLVYHRGVGLDKARGFFPMRKIDYMIGNIMGFVWQFVMLLLLLLQPWKWGQAIQDLLSPTTTDTEKVTDPHHRIVRRSLTDLMDASWFGCLFSTVELQEPTFREMVVVYRSAEDAKKTRAGCPVPVSVKTFKDIPRADFEIVLPAQEPTTRALDLAKLLAAVGVALATVVVKFVQIVEDEEEGVEWEEQSFTEKVQDILPLMVAMCTYIGKIVVQFRAQQKNYYNLMTEYLYNKTQDSGDGVRCSLVESSLYQELKEAMLAYFFLWQSKSGLTMLQLDEQVEEFLRALSDNVDFEVEPSPTCSRDGRDSLTILINRVHTALMWRTVVAVLSTLRGTMKASSRLRMHEKKRQCGACQCLHGPHSKR
eukprot:TRINITY_DN11360_c0_g1_i4.p1 TRINITY_DN11360_c0_g1~~TRINITY_DN11360_c0_g1_i4.p1  ORF type:complete len:527 (+),score=111.13 TRINITY_DN11360_c0_g1_i4:175-1755(+)